LGDNTFGRAVVVGLIKRLCVGGVLISKELTVHSHIFDHMYIQFRKRAKFDLQQQTLHRVDTAYEGQRPSPALSYLKVFRKTWGHFTGVS
jgi:hypothetical protein